MRGFIFSLCLVSLSARAGDQIRSRVRVDASLTATDLRKEFRTLLDGLSSASQIAPLNCIERRAGGALLGVRYKLVLDAEPNYQDAFFVRFQVSESLRTWATLVAYEGRNGFVLGELSKSQEGDVSEYRHSFSGFYNDILRLVVERGTPVILAYRKIDPRGDPFYELRCDLK